MPKKNLCLDLLKYILKDSSQKIYKGITAKAWDVASNNIKKYNKVSSTEKIK